MNCQYWPLGKYKCNSKATHRVFAANGDPVGRVCKTHANAVRTEFNCSAIAFTNKNKNLLKRARHGKPNNENSTNQ